MTASRSSSSLLIGYLFYMQFSRYDAEPFGPGYKNGSFEPSGDGEIRTLDPLLARQVLSQLSYTPTKSGTRLLSHTVSSIVPSAALVLTIVFGMGTGVSPGRIGTRNYALPALR